MNASRNTRSGSLRSTMFNHDRVIPDVRRSESCLRFRIRSLLVFVTLLAVVFAFASILTRDYRERRRIEADLRAMGAQYVGFDEDNNPDWVSFVVPVGSSEIAKYKSFEHVDFSGAHVTDASIRYVAGLQRIMAIHLTQCDITDSQLELLATVGPLKILRPNGSKITNDAIPAVASINGLMAVDLSGTLVTDEGVAELKELRPNIVVRHEPQY